MKDQVFIIRHNGQEVWKAIVAGKVIAAESNSRGAALAAIPVERRRLERRAEERSAFWDRYDGSN